MKRKNILSAILIGLVLSCNCAYADFELNLDNGVIEVLGTAKPEEKITLIAVKENSENPEDVYKMLDFYADEDGSYNKTFKISPSESDIAVDVFVREGSAEKTKKSFVYITEEKMAEFKDALKDSCKDKSGEKTQKLFDDSYDELAYLGLVTDDYKSLTKDNKLIAAKNFADETVDFEDLQSLKNAFYKAVAVAVINECDDFSEYLEKYHSFVIEDELYNTLTADNKLLSWCADIINDSETVDSAEELNTVIRTAEALYKLNNCEHNDFEDILDENAELLDTDKYLGSEFEKLSKSNKIKAIKLTLEQLKDKPATSGKKLCDVINECAKSLTKTTNSTGGGGSSDSGSSKSSSSSVAVISGAVLDTTVTEEEINEPLKPQEYLPFEDVSNDFWARAAIYSMYDKKIISGFDDGSFRPNGLLTREQFVVMVVKAFDIKADGNIEFSDVPEDAWYKNDLKKAYNAGLINGTSETEFGAGKNITRQDIAVILNKAMEISGIYLEDVRTMDSFADFDEASGYAKESIEKLYAKKIISGNGELLRPLGNATRAEAAMMLYNILK